MSKTLAMLLLKTFKQAREWAKEEKTPEDLEFLNSNTIHFIKNIKYLGSVITLLLSKDAKIEMRKKSWSLIGIANDFLTAKTPKPT